VYADRQREDGTICVTTADKVVLKWNGQRYKRTIPLDPDGNNIASVYTAPGYEAYTAYASMREAEAAEIEDEEYVCYDAAEVTDDEFGSDEDSYDEDGTEHYPIVPDEVQRELKTSPQSKMLPNLGGDRY